MKNSLFPAQTLRGLLVLFMLASGGISYPAMSQIQGQVFKDNYQIDPEKKGELSVEIDNLTFFKNNEYEGDIIKGYTLPGLWLTGKAVYYPLRNIKLEAGVYTLYYYGTKRYPAYAYHDIAKWNPDSYQSGVRVLPHFRAQVALSGKLDLILGNLYGKSNHRLIEPLYNPELNLTADPEMGVQLLFNSAHFDADMWVNWESFIYKNDTHQEAFTFGLSTRIKYNSPQSAVHFYMPVLLLAQHRGGEIDTIKTASVHTLMNGAVGLGVEWKTGYRVFTRLKGEVNAMGYYQQAGELWPLEDGKAFHVALGADLSDFRVKAGYWKGDDFISLFGIPYYGSASIANPGTTLAEPSTVYCGLEYSRTFGKGYSLGVDLDIFHTKASGVKQATSFSAGIYFRVNPSFLLKKY